MNNNYDKGSLVKMLRELASIAEEASLSGALEGGAGRAVDRYNAILTMLIEGGDVPSALFDKLDPSTADYSKLGVDAKLLAAYLKNGSDRSSSENNHPHFLLRLAPFVKGEDLAVLVQEHMANSSSIDENFIAHLAPFLPSETLGKLLRHSSIFPPKSAPTTPPSPAAEPTPPPKPSYEAAHPHSEPPLSPTRPPQDELLEVAQQLRRRDLSEEDRLRIAQLLEHLNR